MRKRDASRLLISVLRHNPEVLGLTLDKAGYAPVADIIKGFKEIGVDVTKEDIEKMGENERYRFEGKYHSKMRADYGNSTGLLLKDMYETDSEPPEILYHGTTVEAISGIQEDGIIRFAMNGKKARDHIFLTELQSVAWKKGNRRRGMSGVVLPVRAKKMYEDGYLFYYVKNDIWLTDHVPAEYIDFADMKFSEE